MTPPPYSEESDVDARYRALLFLHAQSPAFRDIDLSGLPGYEELSMDAALQVVAAAPLDQISVSARLAVLYDLNRAGAPDRGLHATGYREVAGSALAGKTDLPPGLGPDSLLDDLVASASAGVPFRHDVQCRDVRPSRDRVRRGPTREGSAASGRAGSKPPGSTPSSRPTLPFTRRRRLGGPAQLAHVGSPVLPAHGPPDSPPAPVDINPPPPGETSTGTASSTRRSRSCRSCEHAAAVQLLARPGRRPP